MHWIKSKLGSTKPQSSTPDLKEPKVFAETFNKLGRFMAKRGYQDAFKVYTDQYTEISHKNTTLSAALELTAYQVFSITNTTPLLKKARADSNIPLLSMVVKFADQHGIYARALIGNIDKDIKTYVQSIIERRNPLSEIEAYLLSDAKIDFNSGWSNSSIDGYPRQINFNESATRAGMPFASLLLANHCDVLGYVVRNDSDKKDELYMRVAASPGIISGKSVITSGVTPFFYTELKGPVANAIIAFTKMSEEHPLKLCVMRFSNKEDMSYNNLEYAQKHNVETLKQELISEGMTPEVAAGVTQLTWGVICKLKVYANQPKPFPLTKVELEKQLYDAGGLPVASVNLLMMEYADIVQPVDYARMDKIPIATQLEQLFSSKEAKSDADIADVKSTPVTNVGMFSANKSADRKDVESKTPKDILEKGQFRIQLARILVEELSEFLEPSTSTLAKESKETSQFRTQNQEAIHQMMSEFKGGDLDKAAIILTDERLNRQGLLSQSRRLCEDFMKTTFAEDKDFNMDLLKQYPKFYDSALKDVLHETQAFLAKKVDAKAEVQGATQKTPTQDSSDSTMSP